MTSTKATLNLKEELHVNVTKSVLIVDLLISTVKKHLRSYLIDEIAITEKVRYPSSL